LFAAEYPEQETGYVDESTIYGDCQPERGRELKSMRGTG